MKDMLLRPAIFTCLAALLGLFALGGAPALWADNAQFDLQGPTLEVKVQRDGKTLPIAQVPTLQQGDRLWLHPVLGEHQSVHYLMVAVFLRGSTNPPPDKWFTKVEAWRKEVIDEGVYLVVPPDAEQAVVLFAPETGGDFSTLKNAVRGRPGSFVRASQDLNIASEDRERINAYVAALRAVDDPAKIKDESNILARSLSLKLNQECFARPEDQQASCLQQSQSALILDNGSSHTAVGLLNGPSSDLAFQAGSAAGVGAGLYDPYISAALDIGRLLASLHSAQYQYIPALSSNKDVEMNLWLNAPPSFHNPKSVLVVSLPPVMKAQAPSLHPVDPNQVFCMQRSPLVLPVDGAPTIFSTAYAHGLTLRLEGAAGKSVELPTKADAAEGGFLVPAPMVQNAGLGNEVKATVHGFWGFDPYTGPSFMLRSTEGSAWTVVSDDKEALVVGRDDELHLHSTAAACVEAVTYSEAHGNDGTATFKPSGADGIVATLPLKDAKPGPVRLAIRQYGLPTPKVVEVPSFAEAGKYQAFTLHAGDPTGVLTGTRLDEVAGLNLHGVPFIPGKLSRSGTTDSLQLTAQQQTAPSKGPAKTPAASPIAALTAGTASSAQLTLKDGRVVPIAVSVDEARPVITLINKNVVLAAAPDPAPTVTVRLSGPEEVPLDGKLTFAIKSQVPETFSKGESVEIATEDGLSSVTLSLASGQLILQDAKTAIGTLDPGKSFSPSAFGPLHMRPILADGITGDWVPIATLVRLPKLESYSCPADPVAAAGQPCSLSGSGLFLLQSISADSQFLKPVMVPDGFAATTLEVPHASNGQLFAKLRDDPTVVNTVSVEMPATRSANRRVRRPASSPALAPPATPLSGGLLRGPTATGTPSRGASTSFSP